MKRGLDTSWEHVAGWYGEIVGKEGHYYHRNVVIPGVIRLLELSRDDSLIDLACGQGILSREIQEDVRYLGVDASKSLLKEAMKLNRRAGFRFECRDVGKPFRLDIEKFSHAAIVLALQDIEDAKMVLSNAASHLLLNGKLVIVIRHPCFRIPRQSGWEIDEKNKIQYRRINRYLSPLKIPISVAPSKGERSPMTWMFHNSITDYSRMLSESGFLVERIEEWTSDKSSKGRNAKMENRSRQEFPLFMALRCVRMERVYGPAR